MLVAIRTLYTITGPENFWLRSCSPQRSLMPYSSQGPALRAQGVLEGTGDSMYTWRQSYTITSLFSPHTVQEVGGVQHEAGPGMQLFQGPSLHLPG